MATRSETANIVATVVLVAGRVEKAEAAGELDVGKKGTSI
jgi:hypothetical protein